MEKTPIKNKQVYAFIDSQNLNLGVQKMGWKMDWRKFRNFLSKKYGVTKAFLFIGHIPEFEDMYNHMFDLGYLVVLKPTFDMTKIKEITNENKPKNELEKNEEKKIVKGNIDAELVLWAMREINNYDKAIIVSGDGDFYCLAEYLDEIGKLGYIMTPNWQYSSLLNNYEKYILRIDKLKNQLAYRKTYSHKL